MSRGFTLHLGRQLAAPPERVFAACVEPEQLREWWGPAGFTSPQLELDVRPGGRYRIAMQPPDGELFYLRGEFVEVEPPRRLSYTFVWEDPDPDDRDTVASLTFLEVEGATELVLEQGEFATEARFELHRSGWSDGLERLACHLERAHSPG
jgi:uncharacterized protein YndB with AHSA1/START domain